MGDEVTITGTLTNADGAALKHVDVTISINGQKTKVKTDLEGNYVLTTTASQAGENTVKVTYYGNARYDAASVETTFNVEA